MYLFYSKHFTMDKKDISLETLADLQFLKALLAPVAEVGKEDEEMQFYTEWEREILEAVPSLDADEEISADVVREYTEFNVERSADNRNYRIHLFIDNAFGNLVDDIHRRVEIMLDRMVAGQVQCFISRATQLRNLTRRRPKLKFPVTLPYLEPSPTTLSGKIREEANVINAAIHYALSRRSPTSYGSVLYINSFSKPKPAQRGWTLGSATVNLYSDRRFLRIRLNKLALPHFNDNDWAATIAHEILHNLGWGHGDGDYRNTNAIEIYERCIRTSDAFQDEQETIR